MSWKSSILLSDSVLSDIESGRSEFSQTGDDPLAQPRATINEVARYGQPSMRRTSDGAPARYIVTALPPVSK